MAPSRNPISPSLLFRRSRTRRNVFTNLFRDFRQAVDSLLRCGICMDFFNVPVMLRGCGHNCASWANFARSSTFCFYCVPHLSPFVLPLLAQVCSECIRRHLGFQKQQHSYTSKCPICDQVSPEGRAVEAMNYRPTDVGPLHFFPVFLAFFSPSSLHRASCSLSPYRFCFPFLCLFPLSTGLSRKRHCFQSRAQAHARCVHCHAVRLGLFLEESQPDMV